MAGGTWNLQNKIRPGVYIRFQSAGGQRLNAGERGVVALCEPMSWGPVAQVQRVEAGANTVPCCGYDITQPQARFLNEIFKGTNRTPAPKTVLLYRPSASGSAQAAAAIGDMTVTARYPGLRGNDIAVTVTESADQTGVFTVATIVDGEIKDSQAASEISELRANDWVVFSGEGTLTATTGTKLSEGADGTVQAAAYSAFLEVIEPYTFDILVYDGNESAVKEAMVRFVRRIAEENGRYSQLVAAELAHPDSRYAINVTSGVVLADGTELTPQQTTWWVGGAQAGAKYNESLTYAKYPGAVAATPVLTNSQIEDGLRKGNLMVTAEEGSVRIEQDINTLVTYTADIGNAFRKNRVMRLCNTVANDIYRQFSEHFIGIVNNNEAGRSLFKNAIVGYLLDVQSSQGIQNFSADDVEILPGEELDSVMVHLQMQPVDSAEKIYLAIKIA